jgi:hypothetical protein
VDNEHGRKVIDRPCEYCGEIMKEVDVSRKMHNYCARLKLQEKRKRDNAEARRIKAKNGALPDEYKNKSNNS